MPHFRETGCHQSAPARPQTRQGRRRLSLLLVHVKLLVAVRNGDVHAREHEVRGHHGSHAAQPELVVALALRLLSRLWRRLAGPAAL